MPESPHRLDAAMDARRLDLHLSWRDVAREADISYETLRAVRRGENSPSPLTTRDIERALHWAAGSVDAVLGGSDPDPLEGASTTCTPQNGGAATSPHVRALEAVWETLSPPEKIVALARIQPDIPRPAVADPCPDPDSPTEQAVWVMDLPETRRRQIIADHRAMEEQRQQRRLA